MPLGPTSDYYWGKASSVNKDRASRKCKVSTLTSHLFLNSQFTNLYSSVCPLSSLANINTNMTNKACSALLCTRYPLSLSRDSDLILTTSLGGKQYLEKSETTRWGGGLWNLRGKSPFMSYEMFADPGARTQSYGLATPWPPPFTTTTSVGQIHRWFKPGECTHQFPTCGMLSVSL